MVGVVLASHSHALAEALRDYVKTVAPEAVVTCAGGMPDGSFGTSYGVVSAAIDEACGPDGAIVLVDMGAAAQVVRMVLDDRRDPAVRMVDCPFVEGAVEATVQAQAGIERDAIIESLKSLSHLRKF